VFLTLVSKAAVAGLAYPTSSSEYAYATNSDTYLQSSQYLVVTRDYRGSKTGFTVDNFSLNGNFAITDSQAGIDFQDTTVTLDAGVGIRVATTDHGIVKSSNSTFNGGGMNDFVSYGYNHNNLLNELDGFRNVINALSNSDTIKTDSGKIQSKHFVYNAQPGLNVVDIDTDDNDFSIEDSTFTIDGDQSAVVVFRILNNDNMLITNSTINLSGDIESNNVLFYTDQDDNDTHFGFSNVELEGVAFWSLGDSGGEISMDNVNGCTQLIADTVDLSDVNLSTCNFAPVPEPITMSLLAFGSLGVLKRRRR